MMRRSARVIAGSVVVAATAALLAIPAAASSRQSARSAQQGVTKDQIDVVLIYPDIDGLKAKGVQSRSSNKAFADKFTAYVDAYGPINGRKVNVISIPWDPIDPTSFDRVCTQATQDNKPLLVVNGTGYNSSAFPCIAIDNKTPFMTGDEVSQTLYKPAGKNLVTMREPTEVTAATGANIYSTQKIIPKTAKIGIVSNNQPELKAAADKFEADMKKKGYDVVGKVEINGLSSNFGTISQGASAAADTLKSAGADTIIQAQSFQAVKPFFTESDKIGANWKYYALDTQGNGCRPSGSAAATLPKSAQGMLCVTTLDFVTKPDLSGIKKDTPVEAKCRAEYEKATGLKTTPGMYSGGADINGVSYENDFPDTECNLTNILLPAIKNAGKNLTWDKVYANILNTKNIPAAHMSAGTGGYAKNKLYFPTKAEVAELHYADKDTPKDATTGLYNGCTAPTSCWVPKVYNGTQWFPLTAN
jgi:hypothetical protein